MSAKSCTEGVATPCTGTGRAGAAQPVDPQLVLVHGNEPMNYNKLSSGGWTRCIDIRVGGDLSTYHLQDES